MLPKSLSTATLTSLMATLYKTICGVSWMFFKKAYRCTPKGCTPSPWRQRGCPLWNANLWSSLRMPDCWSIVMSCLFPPKGPWRFAVNLLGKTTLWNFMECILLWPLCMTLWFSCGLATPRTVPSRDCFHVTSQNYFPPCWCTSESRVSVIIICKHGPNV